MCEAAGWFPRSPAYLGRHSSLGFAPARSSDSAGRESTARRTHALLRRVDCQSRAALPSQAPPDDIAHSPGRVRPGPATQAPNAVREFILSPPGYTARSSPLVPTAVVVVGAVPSTA